MDLHSGLKTQVVKDFKADGFRLAQVRLQHGKNRFTETIHVEPTSWSSSGLQSTDFLHFLGFEHQRCAFMGSECYCRQIPEGFDANGFAGAFASGYMDLKEAQKHLGACGLMVKSPQGWGFFFGTGHSHSPWSEPIGGDGHTGAKSERMKESQDQYFQFVFSWLEGAGFKGWVTHYRPHHTPLAPEFDGALKFLGGFKTCTECPEFDFERCQWRAIGYPEERLDAFYQPAESAHGYFDAHATHFSPGIQKLLDAHVNVSRFGISFLTINENPSRPPLLSSAVMPGTKVSPARSIVSPAFKFDVAVSFAGPERPKAEEIAKLLRAAGLSVFYDNFYPEQLWGKDLAAEFDRIYRKESRFCLMFVSEEYAKRIWTTHERRSALARMVKENGKEYILPVRVDTTDLDGLPPTVGYLSLSEYSVEQVANLLIQKVKS